MYGDTWQVRWKEFLSDSYVYGSKIEFNEDGSVSYKNRPHAAGHGDSHMVFYDEVSRGIG